jgi:hypothetical protein
MSKTITCLGKAKKRRSAFVPHAVLAYAGASVGVVPLCASYMTGCSTPFMGIVPYVSDGPSHDASPDVSDGSSDDASPGIGSIIGIDSALPDASSDVGSIGVDADAGDDAASIGNASDTGQVE